MSWDPIQHDFDELTTNCSTATGNVLVATIRAAAQRSTTVCRLVPERREAIGKERDIHKT